MGTGKLLGKPKKLRGSDLRRTSIPSRGSRNTSRSYRNRDKLRQLWASLGSKASLWKNAFFRTHASKLRYQSAHQRFEDDTIFKYTFVQVLSGLAILRKWQSESSYVIFYFILLTLKQASSLHLLVHFMFVAAILLLSSSPSYDQIRKWLDGSS